MTTTRISTATAGRDVAARAVAACSIAIIAALVVGVGLASGLVLRHVAQTLPLWIVATLSLRRLPGVGWFAIPCYVFWLALMVVIWLYLLGVARIVSGHFTPLEIAMTLVVAVAAIAGVIGAARFSRSVSPPVAVCLFATGAALQWACFRLSLLPGLADR